MDLSSILVYILAYLLLMLIASIFSGVFIAIVNTRRILLPEAVFSVKIEKRIDLLGIICLMLTPFALILHFLMVAVLQIVGIDAGDNLIALFIAIGAGFIMSIYYGRWLQKKLDDINYIDIGKKIISKCSKRRE